MQHSVGFYTRQHGLVGIVERQDVNDVVSVAVAFPAPIDMEPVYSVISVDKECLL